MEQEKSFQYQLPVTIYTPMQTFKYIDCSKIPLRYQVVILPDPLSIVPICSDLLMLIWELILDPRKLEITQVKCV